MLYYSYSLYKYVFRKNDDIKTNIIVICLNFWIRRSILCTEDQDDNTKLICFTSGSKQFHKEGSDQAYILPLTSITVNKLFFTSQKNLFKTNVNFEKLTILKKLNSSYATDNWLTVGCLTTSHKYYIHN